MRRFHAPDGTVRGDVLVLPPAEARHASKVLRLTPGEAFIALDGAGNRFECAATEVRGDRVAARIIRRDHLPRPEPRITVAVGLPKGPAADSIIQRSVELGAAAFQPLAAARCISKPKEEDAKQDRWNAIAVESMKQSGALWRMAIEPIRSVADWTKSASAFDLTVVCSLRPGARPLDQAVAARASSLGRSVKTAVLVAGPEGDFTDDEYDRLEAAGALPVRLGPWVLRVETAVIAGLAQLAASLGL
jgi:16S rRNA (uracil1498-N3)-methyltransferase